MQEAIDEGITDIGENRVQELLSHYECIKSLDGAKLHMIGTLQTNKVKYIIDKVDMIESLSSLSLAKEIDKRAKKYGELNGFAEEMLTGSRTISAYGRQEVVSERFNKINDEAMDAFYKAEYNAALLLFLLNPVHTALMFHNHDIMLLQKHKYQKLIQELCLYSLISCCR